LALAPQPPPNRCSAPRVPSPRDLHDQGSVAQRDSSSTSAGRPQLSPLHTLDAMQPGKTSQPLPVVRVDRNHSIGAHLSSVWMVRPNGRTVCPRSLLITSRQRRSCMDYRSPVWISAHPSGIHLDAL